MINAMRSSFAVLLIVTLMFGGGYFYYIAQAVCPTPLQYRIGALDERFGLSQDEAKLAVAEAAEVWENATGRNLFTYDETAKFSINFIFDDRQALAEAETEFKEKLDAAENINDAISSTYAALVKQYNELQITYKDKVEAYERELATYNETVAHYNQQGGAPADIYEELKQQKRELDTKQTSLNQLAGQLNTLVSEINRIGEKGNLLVENYNEGVGEYNEKFGESRHFTQGDYQGDSINIYTFKDKNELEVVLGHELGHALSLDHVTGSSSVMFYLIGDQPPNISLTENDLAEFNRVCGDVSIWDRIQLSLQL